MAEKLVFAMKIEQPDAVAVIEFNGVCWSIRGLKRARETAKQVGVPGFWRVKPKACV